MEVMWLKEEEVRGGMGLGCGGNKVMNDSYGGFVLEKGLGWGRWLGGVGRRKKVVNL